MTTELALRRLYDDESLEDLNVENISEVLLEFLIIHKEYRLLRKIIKVLLDNGLDNIVNNYHWHHHHDKESANLITRENLVDSMWPIMHYITEAEDEELLNEIIDKYGYDEIFEVAYEYEWATCKMLDKGFRPDDGQLRGMSHCGYPNVTRRLITLGYTFEFMSDIQIVHSLDDVLLLWALDNGMNILEYPDELFEVALFENNIFLYELLKSHGLKIRENADYDSLAFVKNFQFLKILINDGVTLGSHHMSCILDNALKIEDDDMIDFMIHRFIDSGILLGYLHTTYRTIDQYERINKYHNHDIMQTFKRMVHKKYPKVTLHFFEKHKDEIIRELTNNGIEIPRNISPEVLEKIVKYIKPKKMGIIYSEECTKILLRHGFKLSWIDEYKYVSYLNHDPEYKSNDPKIRKIISWNVSYGQRLMKSKGLYDVLIL